jgi:hypothetical protein
VSARIVALASSREENRLGRRTHRQRHDRFGDDRSRADVVPWRAAEGHTHQVADGYDRYFRRQSDGTWIGTRNDRDLRGLPGVDPNDLTK